MVFLTYRVAGHDRLGDDSLLLALGVANVERRSNDRSVWRGTCYVANMRAPARIADNERSTTVQPLCALADQAFSRAAGAPLIAGNDVRLLKNAAENSPAWLEAIGGARRHVHFE